MKRNGLLLPATAFMLLSGVPQVAAAQSQIPQADAQDAGRAGSGQVDLTPYIEASQVLSAQLSPGDDVVTWTQLAAGVDAAISGRNNAAGVSLRYERRIGYGDVRDSDTLSGVARASVGLVPGNVTLDAGALAARTSIGQGGSANLTNFRDVGNTSQIYSVFAGPSFQAAAGDVAVQGGYHVGYSRVESPDAIVAAPGAPAVDVFDESVTHDAQLRASTRPGTVLPVGLGVGGGWREQEVSNLDQRVRDRHLRADVTVQLDYDFAVIGGVGYEDVEVSSRDAVRDVQGNPVSGPDGRFITDKSAPRSIAYETDGLIWDAGVLWRPSTRTSISATVGRRYGSMTYYGALSYQPTVRSSLTLTAYDNITNFGGVLVDNLSALPTDFDAFRNPISGDLTPCVNSTEGNNCALGGIGSVRSAVFRNRGAAASYAVNAGRTGFGFAAGFDRRKFIAAADTVLADLNGVVDESVWAAAFFNQQLDARSGINANALINWFEGGRGEEGSATGYSASLSYYRNLLAGLSGTAAVGLDGITRDALPDYQAASALLGLRYSF